MTASATDTLPGRATAAFTAYRDGDVGALGTLVDLVTPVLWHAARACGLDAATAEDVVQGTWVKLYEGGDRIAEPGAILAWLVTTTRRESWRVSARLGRATPTDFDEPVPPRGEPLGTASAADPEQEVLRDDRDRRLWDHVQRLSPRCQVLMRVICFADAPNYAVLAESLGMPVGSIGPTRGRCLAALRKALLTDPHWSLT
ncbi:RNA polymerase sigma factor [Propionicicella superfundia]|uniref:RNA polymerase sigma factor n=1 Tax=Propionicicella superfundia TaxID=348582 RepID=UPI0003FCD385|nr:sigma-70 family RNA polymerase sigma factor [Propionicicella superfundia]